MVRIHAKQSQFPPRRQERQRLGEKGVMVNSTFDRPRQNKANSGEWDASGGAISGAVAWARRAKQTQFVDCGLRIGKRTAQRPILSVVWTAKCAKQSQLALAYRPDPRAGCTNKPNSRSQLCETNSIPSEDRKSQVLAGKRVMVEWTCTGLRRNKANLPPGGHGTIPSFHHSSIPSFQHSSPLAVVRNKASFWSWPERWIWHPPLRAGWRPV